MSNAEKLYKALQNHHPGGMKTIGELSRNTTGGETEFVVCAHQAFNFDLVKNCATKDAVKEKTPDALFLNGDKLHFIEFKSGKNIERHEIRQKIHEALVSLYQFSILNKVLTRDEFFALHIDYIVIKRGNSQHPMADALDLSIDHFSLRNLEGFILAKAYARSVPKRVLEVLSSVSGKTISSIDYYCAKGVCTTVSL